MIELTKLELMLVDEYRYKILNLMKQSRKLANVIWRRSWRLVWVRPTFV